MTGNRNLLGLLCVLLGFAGALSQLQGQTPIILSTEDLVNFTHSDMDYISNYKEKQSGIEGSPYLERDFETGDVIFQKMRYVNLEIRYNYFQGCFEIRDKDQISSLCPDRFRLDTVWMSDQTFVFVNFLLGDKVGQDYMQLLGHNTSSVFLSQKVILNDAVPSRGYQDASPATLAASPPEIFIQLEGAPAAIRFRGKNSIKELFPEDHADLIEYSKKNRLKLKNSESVIQLCEFYDSLH